jgi:hypothetical protein
VVIGFADAQGRLNRAQASYNAVVDHQNKLNAAVQSLDKLPSANLTNVSASDLQKSKGSFDQVVTQSKEAQGQIAFDDATLSTANDQLSQDQWLTLVSRSRLDKRSAKIGHLRNALAKAKVITAGYVQDGPFYDAFFDMGADLELLGTKAQASDFTAMAAANEKLKTDTAKAVQLENAPGLSPEMVSMLKDVQAFGTDIGKLLDAVTARNEAGINASASAIGADAARLQAHDLKKIGAEVDAYYKPLIDSYNSEIGKANSL